MLLVIAVALIASFWLAGQRVQIESEFRQVEIAVNYDGVTFLSGSTGRDPVVIMEQLREYGVTAVFFREQSLDEAARAGEFAILSGGTLRKEPWFPAAGIELCPNYRYLVTGDERTFDRLRRQMDMRFGRVTAFVVPGGPYVVAAPIRADDLNEIGVGFPAHELEQAAAAGLNVIPQVRTWPGVTESGLIDLAKSIGEMPGVSAVAFNDPRLPGYPGLSCVLAQELAPLGVPVTSIEFHPQAGVRQLGLTLPARQVMLHAISAGEMGRYTPAPAADRLVLAAVERNARVLLVRLFEDPQGTEDLWEVNAAYLRDVTHRLEAAGLTLGAPAAPAPWQPPRALIALVGLGVIAGGLLLWERLRLGRFGPPLGVSAVLAWGALVLLVDLNQAAKLMALAAAVVFPALAVVTVVRERGVPVGQSLLLFAQATGISLVGATFVVGLLSDTGFMLKLDQFAGVKLALTVPILLVVGYFAFRPRDGAGWHTHFHDFLERPVLVKYAVVAAVAAVVASVFLMRAGNEPAMLVSSLELQLRTALDQVLGVRPRLKEFLLGHPWLLLLLFTGYRNARYLPLVALGIIGQVSLVNTFAHLHTPLLISVFRTFNGLWLGVVIGLVLIVAWRVWFDLLKEGGRKNVGRA